MTSNRTPVVFIHGLWLHAASWAPWVELFQEAGYAPVAPGWPGDQETVELARANPEALAGHGIDEVTEHYASIISRLPALPILIGHSFGGMIAEKLLGENLGATAIAIDAAQIKGVLPLPLSSLRSTLPVFKNPANAHRAVSLTAEQFRYAFGNAVSAEELRSPDLAAADSHRDIPRFAERGLTMTFDAVGHLHQHSSDLPCVLRGQPGAELRLGGGCLDVDPYLFVVFGHLYVDILRHE